MNARAAVLILSYNDSGTIAECVRSVRAQARQHELAAVVLADDASRDDTVMKARAAAGERLQLTVLPTPHNYGPWPNLNRSLEYVARLADWAIILHADDIATDGWLDALLTRIDQAEANVASISTSWDMLYPDRVDATGERHDDEVRVIPGSRQAVHDTLLNGCWWKISGAAIRIGAFREIGEFDARVPQCADWDWTMRALERGWHFEYIPRVHTIYRQHAATMSTAALRTDVDIMDAITMLDRFGYTLKKREILRYHVRRGKYALRRMVRGALKADGGRVATSLRTFSVLSRHLIKRLAA
ncbi:MAG TPA: glycosyltransferase family 2 protein [Longimicrobiales bacterium]